MKKKFGILLLMLLISIIISVPAFASDADTSDGFYDISTKENVTIKPFVGEEEVTATDQNVDDDEDLEKWYIGSDRLAVTYSAATADAFYGVLLVEGHELPTRSNQIFYINQETATSNTVDFNVYPMLPTRTTPLTLYISSNAEDFELVSVPLNYAADKNVVPSYTLGDIDNNDKVEIDDAVTALQFVAQILDPTETEKAAADVDGNGKIEIDDAVMILQYVAQIIDSWD